MREKERKREKGTSVRVETAERKRDGGAQRGWRDPVIHSLYHHFAMYLRAFPASFNTAHS